MAIAVPTSLIQLLDDNGDPLNGGTVTVYAAGTTTLLSLFSNEALSTASANPIVLDSAGRHDMRYFATASYKLLFKDSTGTLIASRDHIDPGIAIGTGDLAIADGGTGASTAGAALVNLGAATSAELATLAATVASLAGALGSTDKTHIATGTTAQRPGTPAQGDIRRNTTTARWEGYVASWEQFLTDTEIASQAEMETATSLTKVVTPGRQQNHPGACKAWGSFDGATAALDAGHNITSVVRDSQGDWTVTIATDFSSANYAIVLGFLHATANCHVRVLTQAAGVFTLKADDDNVTDIDPGQIYFACFGDQ